MKIGGGQVGGVVGEGQVRCLQVLGRDFVGAVETVPQFGQPVGRNIEGDHLKSGPSEGDSDEEQEDKIDFDDGPGATLIEHTFRNGLELAEARADTDFAQFGPWVGRRATLSANKEGEEEEAADGKEHGPATVIGWKPGAKGADYASLRGNLLLQMAFCEMVNSSSFKHKLVKPAFVEMLAQVVEHGEDSKSQ